MLSARIKILADFQWEAVVATYADLLDVFGFDERKLGETALLSEAISVIQRVRGVSWVDVDAFGAVPERVLKVTVRPDGTVATNRVCCSRRTTSWIRSRTSSKRA